MSESVSIDILRERFSSEVINPFGEVLIIPSRLFQRGWELELEAQGHRVFVGDRNGEAIFFVRADKSKPKNVKETGLSEGRVSQILNEFKNEKIKDSLENKHREVPSENSSSVSQETKPSSKWDRWKRWTKREVKNLLEMDEAGYDFEKMAKELDRSAIAIERKLARIKGKGESRKTGDSEPLEVVTLEGPSEDTHDVGDEDRIKEFLAAASALYPTFPNACRFLLLETSKLLEVKAK